MPIIRQYWRESRQELTRRGDYFNRFWNTNPCKATATGRKIFSARTGGSTWRDCKDFIWGVDRGAKMGAATKLAFAVFLISCSSGGWKYVNTVINLSLEKQTFIGYLPSCIERQTGIPPPHHHRPHLAIKLIFTVPMMEAIEDWLLD